MRDYVADKIGRLEKYYKNVISAEISIKCDHEDHAGDTFDIKVQIKIPGKDLFAEDVSRDIRNSIDEIEAKLRHQIGKLKEKQNPKKLYKAKEAIRRFFGK